MTRIAPVTVLGSFLTSRTGGTQGAANPAPVGGALSASTGDRAEFSGAARRAAMSGAGAAVESVRMGLVARVRTKIAGGVYESPDKIDVAVKRLMSDLR